MKNIEFKEVTKETVRLAMQALGNGGHEVSYMQVYEALSLTSENQKAVVRTRLSDMLRHGEVVRVKAGCFTYNTKHKAREGKTYVTMWRFVRASKPGWSVTDCAMMTRVSYTQALRYVAWLEGEDYVARAGRNDKRAILYRATPKASASPETPYPPLRETDPFQKERAAAASITRLMLCADPYAPKTGKTIVEACQVLIARFGAITKDENKEATSC